MPISIARYSPKWFGGKNYMAVAPTSFMLSGACTHEEYLAKYDEILSRLSPRKVIEDILNISQGRDVALCCYERPDEFCHRHLLSEWLRKNGYDVNEWKPKEDEKKTTQLSLFD